MEESLHEVRDSEVTIQGPYRARTSATATPPLPITTCDMEVIIRACEEKFEMISR